MLINKSKSTSHFAEGANPEQIYRGVEGIFSEVRTTHQTHQEFVFHLLKPFAFDVVLVAKATLYYRFV